MPKKLEIARGKIKAESANIDLLCNQLEVMLQDAKKDFDLFACDILLREVLLNSIEHACQDMANAQIEFKITIYAEHILITVMDPGPGFDWQSWLQKPYDPDKASGRGLMIIRHYANRFRFNKRGNCISLKRNFH